MTLLSKIRIGPKYPTWLVSILGSTIDARSDVGCYNYRKQRTYTTRYDVHSVIGNVRGGQSAHL